MSLNDPEPSPKANDERAVWELVIADMQTRDQVGALKYGMRLTAHNGRDALTDAYQEALDLAVYLRQEIQERRIITVTVEEITQRICDPGAFLQRGNNYDEPIISWGARAVMALLEERGLHVIQ